MKLLSLETVNFKKLGTRRIEFTDGVNFIVGGNGQGKTTILRAVAVAKFGVTMLPGVADDVPTRGTDTWSVKLSFEHLGKVYDVVRGKSAAYVSVNGAKQANGQSATTAYVEDLLNITAKDYNLLLHSRQGETNYVITYGATALQRKVEEFAGISELDKIVSLSNTKSRDEKAKSEWITAQLPSSEEVKAKQESVSNLTSTVQEKTDELTELQNKKVPAEPAAPSFCLTTERSKLRKFYAYLQDVNEYQKDRDRLQLEISELPEPIEVPEAGDLRGKLNTLRKNLSDLQAEKQEHQEKVNRKSFLEESLKEAAGDAWGDKLLQQCSEAVAAIHLTKEKAQAECSASGNNKDELSRKVEHLKSQISEGVCSSCGTELQTDVDVLREQLKEATDQLSAAAKDHAAKAEWLAAVTVDETAAKATHAKLKETTDKVLDLQSKISAIVIEPVLDAKQTEDYLQSEIHKVRAESTRISDIQEEAEALEAKRTRLSNRLTKMEAPEPVEEVTDAAVKAMEDEQSAYEVAKANWSRLAESHTRDLKEKSLEVENAETKLEEVKKGLHDISVLAKEAEKWQGSASVADKLSKYLRDRRATYLTAVWDSIMAVASEFLNASTQGAMTEVAIDTGKFMFREDGAWVPAIETSGAQAAFLGTALRIGLNKALYRGDTFLAFDEPTEAMTEENARNLVATIAGASDQVFLVSHKQTDQVLASNIIEV